MIYIHDDEVELESRRKFWSDILQAAEREAFEAYVAAGKHHSCNSDEDTHTHKHKHTHTNICNSILYANVRNIDIYNKLLYGAAGKHGSRNSDQCVCVCVCVCVCARARTYIHAYIYRQTPQPPRRRGDTVTSTSGFPRVFVCRSTRSAVVKLACHSTHWAIYCAIYWRCGRQQ